MLFRPDEEVTKMGIRIRSERDHERIQLVLLGLIPGLMIGFIVCSVISILT